MLITDARRTILRVNHAFTKITGYSAEEALGKTPNLLNSGLHPAEFFSAISDSLMQNGTWQGEIWNRRKNGEIYPEWLTITAVRDEQQQVANYVATLNDITFRKQAEDEIKHLAFYDPLTKLPNRRLTLDRLRHALAVAERDDRHHPPQNAAGDLCWVLTARSGRQTSRSRGVRSSGETRWRRTRSLRGSRRGSRRRGQTGHNARLCTRSRRAYCHWPRRCRR